MLTPLRRRTARFVATLVAVAALLAHLPPSAVAQQPANDIGYPGPSYQGAIAGPSASKTQSKLWREDGFWWAVLFSADQGEFHIFRLDRAASRWVDTGVAVDDRSASRADVLAFEDRLYVVSGGSPTTPGAEVRLYRYDYDASEVTYVLDLGFPIAIGEDGPEPVLARAGDGMLWGTWTSGDAVEVAHTNGADDRWAEPFVLPPSSGDADIASIIAFGAGDVGVMWSSSEPSDGYFFATHTLEDPPQVWSDAEPALTGRGTRDDHVSLAQTGDGRLFAVVKTAGLGSGTVDLIVLLERSVDGIWTPHSVGRRDDSHTRPILLLDAEAGLAHVVMTGPHPSTDVGQRGGDVVVKTASLDDLSFELGVGRRIMSSTTSINLNDATSTKQSVDATTGLVAVASNQDKQEYWFADDPELRSDALVADFTATNRTSLLLPQPVTFLDRSAGAPLTWSWDFGDGSPPSAEPNPTHVYRRVGEWTVRLTVSDGTATDTSVVERFVTTGTPSVAGGPPSPPPASRETGPAALAVAGVFGLAAILLLLTALRRARRPRP